MPWAKIATTVSATIATLAGMGALMMKVAKGTFQTVEGCERVNNKCVEVQLKPMKLSIDSLHEKLGKMDESRQRSGEVLADQLQRIALFMGRVEQYMKDRE